MPAAIPVLSRVERQAGRQPDAVVLVSGGVDSALALALLQRQGYSLFALTLLLPHFSGLAEDGSRLFGDSAAAVKPAETLCAAMGVSHAVLDLRQVFHNLVIAPFANAYRGGRTPNPCVRCNPLVKFGLARAWAEQEVGCDVVATGHYAGIVATAQGKRLTRIHDIDKDQSYFLYRLPAGDCERTLFPLAAFADKEAVRSEARALGLAVSETKDSQDICFLPGGDYRPLVAENDQPGDILDCNGTILGRHRGSVNFTVGQRKGFGIGFGKPMYAVRIDPEQNSVTVGTRSEAEQETVTAADLVIHDAAAAQPGSRVWAKIRSGGQPRPAQVTTFRPDRLTVRFGQPVFAPAAGQHLVLYDADGLVVGGGEITYG